MRWHQILKEYELVSVATSAPLIHPDTLKWQTRNIPDPDITDEDSLYNIYCNAAEKLIEGACEITLRQKVLKLHLSAFPDYCDFVRLRYEIPPVTAITHIKYYDGDDTQQTLSSALYETWLNHAPPETLIKASNVPLLSPERTKRIEIQLTAGHTGAIPANAQEAILLLVAFWYNNKEAWGKLPAPLDGAQGLAFSSLLDSLRWRVYP